MSNPPSPDPDPPHSVRHIPLGQIEVSRRNPRQAMTEINELAGSLQAHGLLQPIVVRQRARGYELIAGHRRLAAAEQLGWETIPAVVREEHELEAYILMLVENLQRQDLSAEEEARGLSELVQRYGWSTRQVASAVKRSQAYVSKRLRVFEDPVLRAAVLERGLGPSVAEELLAADPERRPELVERAVAERWGMAEARAALRGRLSRPGTASPAGQEAARPGASARRPSGFTRSVCDLRRALNRMFPEDLTDADRRELRLLFMDLAKLARARPGRREVVVPPLPVRRSRNAS